MGKITRHSIALATFLLATLLSATAAGATRTIGVLVYDGVLTSDVTAPLEVFGVASREAWFSNYQVITISLEPATTITTEEGLTIGVDAWVGDVDTLDALITTSSYNMSKHLKNTALKALIQKIHNADGYLSSNCSGAQFLAEAGVLDGRKATTWFGGEDDFQRSYPKVRVQKDVNVMIDEKIVTSNGSVVSYQSALTLLRLMSSEGHARDVADALQYPRLSSQPY